jgi:hypothetical protein
VKVSVGFSTSSWWVSRLIRWATRASCSHAFILIEGTELGDLVLEAEWCGVKLSTKAALTRGTTYIVDVIHPKTDLTAATLVALTWLDERYNYEGLFGMFFVEMAARLKKRIRNPLRNSKSLFCSELVVWILETAKYPDAQTLDPQSVQPDALRGYMRLREGLP